MTQFFLLYRFRSRDRTTRLKSVFRVDEATPEKRVLHQQLLHFSLVCSLAKTTNNSAQDVVVVIVISKLLKCHWIACGAWWHIGRVDAFRLEGRGIPLQPPPKDLEKVLHLQLPVALRHANSDTVYVQVHL